MFKVDKKRQHQFFKIFRSSGTSNVLITSMTSQSYKCEFCHNNHEIRNCPSFLIKKPNERFKFIKERRMCINCLRGGHSASNCTSKFLCKNCNKSQHSLLHFKTVHKVSLQRSINNTTPISSQESSTIPTNVQRNSVVLQSDVSNENSSTTFIVSC